MIVFSRLDEINITDKTCITIGNFDGVHRGHQTLISKTVDYARMNGLKSVVFTFSNHPVNYFIPGSVKNIITIEEKLRIIESMGVDICVNIEFNSDMTSISAEDYVKKILLGKLNMRKLIVGHDFSFAKNREGNPAYLESVKDEFGFELEIVAPILLNGTRVSSTDIRANIIEGNVTSVAFMSDRFYSIDGVVIKGRQIGTKIGYPTANIDYDRGLVIPADGVYATLVEIDAKKYKGATSIGNNPTVDGDKTTVETYILDFDQDIYGKDIRVEFVELMRPMIKFETIEELTDQLKADEEYVRNKYSDII